MNDDAKKLLERYQLKPVKTVTPDRQLLIVRCDPSGKILAAGGCDGKVHRWDLSAKDLPELSSLTGHDGWVQALAFHPDGKRLFTADTWGRLICWPYHDENPKPLWTVEAAHDGWVRQLAVSPDGKALATCGADRRMRLWDTENGQKRQELSHDQDVFSLAFHPAGKELVSGDLKGGVKQWDLATFKSVRDFDARLLYFYERIQDVGGVRRLLFDSAGTMLIAAGTQPKSGGFVQGVPAVLVFDWVSGKLSHTLKIGGEADGFVHDLALHADGFLMGVTSGQPGNGKLFFQRPEDAEPFFTAPSPNSHSLAVHPDGVRLIVSATNTGSNGNGRQLDKNKEYPGNFSPLTVWELAKK